MKINSFYMAATNIVINSRGPFLCTFSLFIYFFYFFCLGSSSALCIYILFCFPPSCSYIFSALFHNWQGVASVSTTAVLSTKSSVATSPTQVHDVIIYFDGLWYR
jgi:hypothetical protein